MSITHVTEQWLTDQVKQMPYWGSGNKWQYHYGTVRVPAGICINFTQEWIRPSRVLLEFEKPAYKEFNCQPDENSAQWWRDNPGRYLISQTSQGGDGEFDGSMAGISMRGSWPGGEPVANCLRFFGDDEWAIRDCSFWDYLAIGVEDYNSRRGKYENCRFIGQLKPVQDADPPKTMGLWSRKGNLHLDTCFFQRNERAIQLEGLEQYSDINCHFENNKTAWGVSGCQTFKNCGPATIRSSGKYFLVANSHAFRNPGIHCNVQAIYAGHTEEGGKLKRIPSATAGIMIAGKEYELVHSGASRVDGHETARFPKPLDVSGIVAEQQRLSNAIDQLKSGYDLHESAIKNQSVIFEDKIAKLDSRCSGIEAAVIHLNEIRDAIHEATE